MSGQFRCRCQSCTIRGMLGPSVLITIGVLFLLHEMHGGRFDFGNTWPAILMVIGIILLASSLAPRDGHIEPPPIPVQLPPGPGVAGIPPTAPPPASTSGQGQ
jgi:hypothetical protein